MESELLDEMFRLEQTHWWFSAKREIVLSLLARWLPSPETDKDKQVIYDIGCGCGAMLVQLREKGYHAVGMDANDRCLDYCRRRHVPVQKGSLPNEIPADLNNADAVLLLDVLEHIEEDRQALGSAGRIAAPGGILIVTVPACPWLWTRRDVHHHHFRRYTKSDVSRMVQSTPDLSLLFLSYMNTFLFPFAVVERCFRKLVSSPAKKTDLHIPPSALNSLLKAVYTAEKNFFLKTIAFPVGLSLIAVLRKTTEKTMIPG